MLFSFASRHQCQPLLSMLDMGVIECWGGKEFQVIKSDF